MKIFPSYCFLVVIFIFSFSSSVVGMDFDSKEEIEGNHQQTPQPIRVIIAEDEPVAQKIYASIFKTPFYEPTIVNNGSELCRIYAPGLFDLILTDGCMPLMDGYEAITSLVKKYGEGTLPPIIAVSANTSIEDREKFFTAGARIVLPKPIDKTRLLKEINPFFSQLSPQPLDAMDQNVQQ